MDIVTRAWALYSMYGSCRYICKEASWKGQESYTKQDSNIRRAVSTVKPSAYIHKRGSHLTWVALVHTVGSAKQYCSYTEEDIGRELSPDGSILPRPGSCLVEAIADDPSVEEIL